MFETLLGGAAGGIFGILGALFKHGIEVYQEKKKSEASLAVLVETNKHELNMADKQAELIKLEADNAVALANINAQKEIDAASYESLNASYENDKATYSNAPASPWLIAVDFIRGIIRPLLTIIFSGALMWATFWLLFTVPEAALNNQAFLTQTLYRLISSLIFLAEASVGWWFAARQLQSRK
jgi:hypothetical protein